MNRQTTPVWTPYFARKFSASRFEIVMRVFSSPFYRKEFGAHLANCLVTPGDGRNYTIYYQADEWQRFERQVYETFCRTPASFARYRHMIKRTQRQSLFVAESIVAHKLTERSWPELGRLWARWDRAHLAHFLRGIWIIFITEPLLAAAALAALEAAAARSGRSDELSAFRDTVFSPSRPNALAYERHSLLEIALAWTTTHPSKQQSVLERHATRFGFIPCYDAIDSPWSWEHFQAELDALLQTSVDAITAELRELATKFGLRRRAFATLLATLKPTDREAALLRMAHEVAYLKDERDDYRRRQMATIRPFYDELARRFDLPLRAPLYMIRSEMVAWFSTGTLPIKREALLARLDRYALRQVNDGPIVAFEGVHVDELLASERFVAATSSPSELRGLTGSGGLARGPVRIVYTVHDLKKVQAGDVMVAVTTNPDYLAAMKRCVAFVTDEGGITSHAAIVARELTVPCIVGTKQATKSFVDGELVEVDATHGVINKVAQ